jgi:hypothetical protein
MNKLFFFLPLLSLLFLSASCDDNNGDDDTVPTGEGTGSISLNFTGTYGDDPLVMFDREYDYPEDMNLKLQLFQFYISNVNLIKTKNGQQEKVSLVDVDIISFGDIYNDEDALSGKSIPDIELPVDTFQGIELGFGLTEELNASNANDFNIGHPLSENYWGELTKYIFFKIEGNGDLDGDGAFDQILTYHIGGDDNFKMLTFDREIIIPKDGTLELNVNVDLEKILVAEDGTFLDIRDISTHHAADSPTATFLGNNVTSAVSLK